jgi:CheY-like chemotaxis protein
MHTQPRKNILIVDDIVDDLLMFEDCIEELGNVAHLALTPADASEIFKKVRPDLIVWNTDIPKSWDELKVLAKNRSWREIPMIAIVGANNERAAEQALRLGCIGLMRKPIGEGIIAEVLTQGLRPPKSAARKLARQGIRKPARRAARHASKK